MSELMGALTPWFDAILLLAGALALGLALRWWFRFKIQNLAQYALYRDEFYDLAHRYANEAKSTQTHLKQLEMMSSLYLRDDLITIVMKSLQETYRSKVRRERLAVTHSRYVGDELFYKACASFFLAVSYKYPVRGFFVRSLLATLMQNPDSGLVEVSVNKGFRFAHV